MSFDNLRRNTLARPSKLPTLFVQLVFREFQRQSVRTQGQRMGKPVDLQRLVRASCIVHPVFFPFILHRSSLISHPPSPSTTMHGLSIGE